MTAICRAGSDGAGGAMAAAARKDDGDLAMGRGKDEVGGVKTENC